MRERINLSKNVTPDALAKKLGLPEGRYSAFKGVELIYVVEDQILLKKAKEFRRLKKMTWDEFRDRVIRRQLMQIPQGSYNIRRTKRAYSLEQAA